MADLDLLSKENRHEAPSESPKKFRVQLDFPEPDFNEVNALAKRLGFSTRAELFRNALITLRWISQKKAQGYTIVAMSPDHERLIEPEFSFLGQSDLTR